ncbi:HAUS augmin-like complex subunit 6 N-terminus-domain-containing protein [Podospora aff. communis PSN243]|uniref:HAUS augmin-like complex subunit 6 N-terminus-domain-containing protein n=1 Tax=Podospora aff. communis PSN243 TaxID=3040156 RepID=A0AAV9GNH2_9PEZI|nr:HAUS augmin-like complex subunit 6 N-terminus-domain-containing protein [Podospora aff. communis PSN243]
MASLHGSSSLTRTRSARLPPPNSSRTILVPSRGPPSNGSSTTSTAPPPSPTATPTSAPNISLFLTNLRLLDLDLYPDWPDISASTFGTRDAAQGQKRRIQCVEWALYRLFTLWDPDEARDKLQPFFPPLDQVQSLNLRAALLRSLEHAKKNGVLGRDAVVRKTMLDECKGERLEEVLAAFSSAVLKKLVMEQQLNEPEFPALAQTLALENRGYSGERGELVTLILAHKFSLRRKLESKDRARARYDDFSQLMKVKESCIARRRAEARAAQEEGQSQGDISEDMKLDVWRTVRNNWSGNERWMETLLYGDSHTRKDGVLSTPFDRIWRRVESGRLCELEDSKSEGLLKQLDGRVKSQKERLEKWQGFRQRMFGRTGTEPRAEEAAARQRERGIDLGFRAHENLHLGRMSPRKLARVTPSAADDEYTDLIRSLKRELAGISAPAASIPAFFQRPQEPVQAGAGPNLDSTSPEPEAISELSEIEDGPFPLRPSPPRREPVKAIEHVLRRKESLRYEHPQLNGEQPDFPHLRRSATLQSKHSPVSERRPPSASPTRSPERRSSPPRARHSPPPLAWSPPRDAPLSPVRTPSPERPISPTQQLADQILASVEAASPSPIKKPRHTLSLAERTRLSMARRTSNIPSRIDVEDYDAEPEVDDYHVRRGPTVSVDPPARSVNGNAADAEGDPHEDLVARTRRSMAGFEAAQKKAQLERRRSLRKSKQIQPAAGGRNSVYFPAVDEEENSTLLLAEELMSGEVDQDTVFMSRPKIKTSPVGTPVRGSIWND